MLSESIYNLDETGINTDPRAKKVFVPRTSRDAYLMSATCGKAMYSVMFCVSAAGNYLPPILSIKDYTFTTPGQVVDCLDVHMIPLQVAECKIMSLKIGSRTFLSGPLSQTRNQSCSYMMVMEVI